MRLLNTSTLRLEEFSSRPPPYAILSHTWGAEEISFQDINAAGPGPVTKAGFEKVEKACTQAQLHALRYIWVDTCCIDKSSSAELSEAINSMFRWYRDAECCYAYLADVDCDEDFAHSRWFTRGWTLQELLAPSEVIFFTREWAVLGRKQDLAGAISDVAGINSYYLQKSVSRIREASIAERMSWASRRVTTRTEDMAYCLMGIFDVNIPLLYGEGERAFTRLQMEIMAHSGDQSIFAWGDNDRDIWQENEARLLAKSPAEFLQSGGKISPFASRRTSEPYTMTNTGLHIQLPLYTDGDTAWAVLRCRPRHDHSHTYAIGLRRYADGTYERASPKVLLVDYRLWRRFCLTPIYIRMNPMAEHEDRSLGWSYVFRKLPPGFEVQEVYPTTSWYAERQVNAGSPDSARRDTRLAKLSTRNRGSFLVVLRAVQGSLGDLLPEVMITPIAQEKLVDLAKTWRKLRPSKYLNLEGGIQLVVEDYPEMVLWQDIFVVDIHLRQKESKSPERSFLTSLGRAVTAIITFIVYGFLDRPPTRLTSIWLYRRNALGSIITDSFEEYPVFALIVAILVPLAIPLPRWAVFSFAFLFISRLAWPLLNWSRTRFELQALPKIQIARGKS